MLAGQFTGSDGHYIPHGHSGFVMNGNA